MKSPQRMVELVEEYLTYRRKLGFQLEIEGKELLRFARFADQAKHQGPLTAELATRWATLPPNADPLYWARRLDIVRRFAKHRALFDPTTQIPHEGILGPSYRRSPPHIYSDKEIANLLSAASKLGPPNGLRPHTYRTLFGLLTCTGLRISEALRMSREDVDWKAALLTIRETKFKKSRLVPLHPSTARALRRYSQHRDRVMFATLYNTGARVSEVIKLRADNLCLDHHCCLTIDGKGKKQRAVPLWKSTADQITKWLKRIDHTPGAPLFPNRSGKPLTRSGVEHRLRLAVEEAIKRCPSLQGKRVSPHTLRHTTAMHLLQSGVDITVIALWLGHESPSTTHL